MTATRGDGDVEITQGEDSAPLATVYGNDDDPQCWPVSANAALIASAPEQQAKIEALADALEKALRALKSGDDEAAGGAILDGNAALRLAGRLP